MRRSPFLPDPDRIKGYRWLLIIGLMACSTPIYWYAFSIGILLPDMRLDLGLTPAGEGWLSSAFFLGSFLFTIPLTSLLSRLPPARLMAAVFAASAGLFFVAWAFPYYPAQVAVRFLVAVLFVANNPVRTLIIHGWFRPAEYPLANGVSNSMFGVVEPIAFWSTAPLMAVGGWQGMMLFFGGFTALTAAAWMLFARDHADAARSREAERHDSGSSLAVLRRREVWYMGMIAFGGNLTWTTFITFWPTFAQQSFGISDDLVGLYLALGSITVVPASLAAPWLLVRFGRRTPLLIGCALFQVPTFTLMLVTSEPAFLALISLAQGLSWAYYPILLTAPFQLEGSTARAIAVASAFIIVINTGAQAVGPAVAGGLAEALPLRTVLFALSFGPLVSALGGFLLGEPGSGRRVGATLPTLKAEA